MRLEFKSRASWLLLMRFSDVFLGVNVLRA